MHRTYVKVLEDVLDANGTIALANRRDFDEHGVAVVNLMGSPGAGKTAVLEAALPRLRDLRVGVLEGDVQGSLDAERLASLHVPVTQINTDSGFGGECHLDANMVRSAIPSLPLGEIDLLPHLDFDLDLYLRNLETVHPGVPYTLVSARTGEGIGAWREWLLRRAAREPAIA